MSRAQTRPSFLPRLRQAARFVQYQPPMSSPSTIGAAAERRHRSQVWRGSFLISGCEPGRLSTTSWAPLTRGPDEHRTVPGHAPLFEVPRVALGPGQQPTTEPNVGLTRACRSKDLLNLPTGRTHTHVGAGLSLLALRRGRRHEILTLGTPHRGPPHGLRFAPQTLQTRVISRSRYNARAVNCVMSRMIMLTRFSGSRRSADSTRRFRAACSCGDMNDFTAATPC